VLGDRSELGRQVRTDYPPYGKRILLDNVGIETLCKPNIDLVTQPIERIEPEASASLTDRSLKPTCSSSHGFRRIPERLSH